MAFLGSKACHEECGARIMDYLERARDGSRRAIAFDCINLGDPDVARGRWAAMMDATRALAGNDAGWGSRRCVTYHHFVISPDPRDGVGTEALRELATEWASEFFGTQSQPGRLGSYEVAIVYHDDNGRGIPHAHVIVNNTDLDTGRRLHIDAAQNAALTDRLQEMCRERGLSFFGGEEDGGPLQREGRYFTREERRMLRQGRFSWKQDIANNIVVALRTSRTEEEFAQACERHGIGVSERDGDYVFTHFHNEGRWRVRGRRLGRNYTRAHILAQLEGNAARFDRGLAALRENVSRHVLADLFDGMDLVAVVEHGARVRDVARALAANERFGIRSMGDYGRCAAAVRAQLDAARDPELRAALAGQLEELELARDLAGRAELFEGVELGPARQPEAALPAAGGAAAGRGARGKGAAGAGGRRRAGPGKPKGGRPPEARRPAPGGDQAKGPRRAGAGK